jgi:hypothetical protein
MQRSWIGWVSNSVTFDVKPLDTLRAEKGSEGSCNWVWVVQREIDDDPSTVAVLQQPLSNRRKRIDLTGAMLNLAHRCCLIASLPVNTATIPPPRCAWSRDSVTPLEAVRTARPPAIVAVYASPAARPQRLAVEILRLCSEKRARHDSNCDDCARPEPKRPIRVQERGTSADRR